MIHVLKSWPNNFRALAGGRRVDIRTTTDRSFAAGDYVLLREYQPDRAVCTVHGAQRCRQGCDNYTVAGGEHTGSLLLAQVTNVLVGSGEPETLLPTGTAALSLQVLDEKIS